MAKLKVENSAQTTFRLSPVSFRAPRKGSTDTDTGMAEIEILALSMPIN